MIKRLRYRSLYKKAVKYLENIDFSILIQASDKIQSYHINEKAEIGYFHHFPLKDKSEFYLLESNWDLSDTIKKELHELLGILDEYQRSISIVRYYTAKGEFNLSGNSFICEILPPWIIYPHYSALSMGWRQGTAEGYVETFICYINSLSDEQYEAYLHAYPIPEYMIINSFGFNFMNHHYAEDKVVKEL